MSDIACDGQQCDLYSRVTRLYSLSPDDKGVMELRRTKGALPVTNNARTVTNNARTVTNNARREHGGVCITTNSLVLTAILVSLLCGPSTAATHHHHDNGDTMETESDDVLRALRRLDEEQSRQRHQDEQRRAQTRALVRDSFPWLLDTTSLYKPLLHPPPSHHVPSAAAADVVFVSGLGGHEDLTDCLSRVSMDATRDAMSTDVASPLLYTTHIARSVCREHAQNAATCSHVMFMDEPLINAHHSFTFCKKNPSDEMCRVHYVHSMSLKEWVALRGSWYVQQLVYGDAQCNQTVPSHRHNQYFHHSQEMPCWYRAKLKWDQLSPEVRRSVVDFIVEKFESWFSVVGLVKHVWKSLHIVENIYNLPLTQCTRTNRHTGTEYNNNNNRASNSHSKRRYDLDDPEYLRSDREVTRVLSEDDAVYRAARHMYIKERQLVFNSVAG